MIHAIKHEMDPNSNINYRRKIAPRSMKMNQDVKSKISKLEIQS